MTTKKKILTWAAAGGALLALLYVGGNLLLTTATREALQRASRQARKQGVDAALADFDRVRIVGLRTAQWSGIRLKLRFREQGEFSDASRCDVAIDKLSVTLLGGGMARIAADGNLRKQARSA